MISPLLAPGAVEQTEAYVNGANSAAVWFGGYTLSPAVGVPAFPQMLPEFGYVNVA
jgi:hypothetical protein